MSEPTQCVNCGFEFMPDEYLTNRCPQCGWLAGEPVIMYVVGKPAEPPEPDPISPEVLDEICQMVTTTTNEWLQNGYGLPLTVSINRLALSLVGMLKNAYVHWSRKEGQK